MKIAGQLGLAAAEATIEKQLRIVLVEDHPADAEMIAHELGRAGLHVEWMRVDSEEAYRDALALSPDAILADHVLSRFSALEALRIRHELNLDIPFIVVAGAIEEQDAIECLQQGASDYLLKDRLGRLGFAVQQAVKQQQVVTQCDRLEHELSVSEQRFRLLAENAQDLIFRYQVRPSRVFEYVSPASTSLVGYSPEEHYADPELGLKIVHPDDLPSLERAMHEVLSGQRNTVTLRWRRRDGGLIWTEQHNSPIYGPDGPVIAIEGIAHDVTERVRATQELAARAREQAAVAALGQRALATADLAAVMDDAVHVVADTIGVELCKILQLTPDGSALRLVAGVGWQPGLVGTAMVAAERGSQAGYTLRSAAPVVVESVAEEVRFQAPPLLRTHGVVSGLSVVIPAQPAPYGVLGAHTITRRAFTADEIRFLQLVANVLSAAITRHRTQLALERSERHYRALIEHSQDGIVLVDTRGNIRYCSPSVATILGYRPESMIGASAFEFIHPEDTDLLTDLLREVLASPGVPLVRTARLRHASGGWRWLEGTMTNLLDEPTVEALVVNYRDVTARREAYDALRESEARFTAFMEGLPIGVLVAEANGRLYYANRAARDLTGEEILPRDGARVGTESVPLFVAGTNQPYPHDRRPLVRALAGEAATADDLEVHVGDRATPLEAWATPILDDNGEVRYAITAFWDITERRATERALKESEARLRQAQKMEAIGMLAGGIAHDFNNLLTAIIGFSEVLSQHFSPEDPRRTYLQQIEDAGQRAAMLTGQLLAFGRRQPQALQILDLNDILSGAQQLLGRIIGEDITLVTELSATNARVRADRSQLEQIIFNLCVNARDAMPTGGRLTLTTASVQHRVMGEDARASAEPTECVLLSVSDTGAGMDAATLAHIFEPFFTTKGTGKGTGLGLATVYGIVHQSGGDIEVGSTLGEGTTFRIYLPCVTEPAEVIALPGADRRFPRGSETVLLVEDEPGVRNLAERVLELCGYRVLSAASPQAALTLVNGFNGTIDLLLTDVVMPGMHGPDLARRVQELRPGLRVIFMSGYPGEVAVRHGVMSDGYLYLPKPFTPAQLSQAVRDVLDAPASLA